jgi:hypothetical protein
MDNSSMFGMGGRIPITTYYRTISVDNKPTTVIIGPSEYKLQYCILGWVDVGTTDISQYRLRFGSSLLYKSVFHLNSLTAQLSYEGRVPVEGGK